jgi:hypothetical protein
MSLNTHVRSAFGSGRLATPRGCASASWKAVLAVAAVLATATPSVAQQTAAEQNGGKPAGRQPAAQQASLDVSRLPVNVQRIQRRLAQSTREREERNGLNLQYVIDVFGQAPPIEIFNREDPNLLTGPAPYGAPTHREMIYMMTPQEFRSPVMDFSALSRWLASRGKK